MLTRLRLIPTVLLLLATGAAVSHADPTAYDQPASNASTQGYDTYPSYDGAGVSPEITYDDFTPATASYVTAVQWRGNYIAYESNANTNEVSPNANSFTITFLADDGGSPGAVLSTATVDIAACQQQSLGTLSFKYASGNGPYTISFYSYRAVLPGPFAVAAGQKYWMSIVANQDSGGSYWCWYSSSSQSNGTSLLIYGTGQQTLQLNRNFTLEGVPSAFLAGDVPLGNGVYYLGFSDGNYFGYYSYLSDPRYLYHFDLGYEYVFDANDGKSGVYLYDFKSKDFFYTSPSFPFPYLYDFGLNTTLYYYPDPKNAGHYNTNGVRYFYDFATGKIISK